MKEKLNNIKFDAILNFAGISYTLTGFLFIIPFT